MDSIIISLEIGLLALIVIIGLAMFTKKLDSIHRDVRRCIELGFCKILLWRLSTQNI